MRRKKKYTKVLIMMLTASLLLMTCLASCGSSGKEEDAGAERIPILAYHKIVPAGTEFESSLLIAEDTFEEQMKYLHDEGYTTLTPDELCEWYEGKEFPEKSVMITFDDGYYGTYYLAYPIIKKYDQAATVFCIGHHIDETTAEWDPHASEDHYIGADVIRKMREEYPRFRFESHTFDMHRKIDNEHPADIFTYDQMVEDIRKNEEYGFTYLAYPWGDHNETFEKALADNGYKMAFNYRPYYYATRSDGRYVMNRIKISGKMGMRKFKKIVSGRSKDHINPDA